MKRKPIPVVLLAVLAFAAALAAQEKVDLAVVHRIRTEALENSRVMDHVFYLSDVYGPRLTGSPGFEGAANWSVKQLRGWGLENVTLEKWGPFGRSWSLVKYSGNLVEPQRAPITGFPLPWSPGTQGPVSGEPVFAQLPITTDQELDAAMEKLKGKLRGKIVMLGTPTELSMQATPASRRLTDTELAPPLSPQPGRSPFDGLIPRPPVNRQAGQKRTARRLRFLKDEGALLVITPGQRGEWGVIVAGAGGSRDPQDALPPPMVAISAEHYNRIARLLAGKIPVRLEFDIDAKLQNENADSFNVIAEIPGARRKDEVVMLGAHLDSWTGGTGAADDAAGCAVMMEAMRILKMLDLKMDRTVRLALWSAEESGLLGSKAYVKEHFADPQTMVLKPEHGKLSAYFNFDNGSGKIRGVYLQGNDMVRPVFEAWLAPFKDLGATALNARRTTGTDHVSFDAVGLPGFQFIQDPLEYSTRTHHANLDVYERVQAGDLMQASAIVASFAYNAATRSELLPRKPLPKPASKKSQ